MSTDREQTINSTPYHTDMSKRMSDTPPASAQELFVEAIYREILEERAKGIHVTDLARETDEGKDPCLRQAWYEHTQPRKPTLESALNFYFGKMIHKTPLFPDPEATHEVPLLWHDIHGTRDEFHPTWYGGWLIEKKTVLNEWAWRRLKKKGARPKDDHIVQTHYYSTMGMHLGQEVKRISIAYIRPISNKNINNVFVSFPIKLPNYQETTYEMVKRQEILQAAIDGDTPPPRVLSWRCGYCQYAGECWGTKDE